MQRDSAWDDTWLEGWITQGRVPRRVCELIAVTSRTDLLSLRMSTSGAEPDCTILLLHCIAAGCLMSGGLPAQLHTCLQLPFRCPAQPMQGSSPRCLATHADTRPSSCCSHRHVTENLMGDAFEALTAAIYLDRGLKAAARFIMRSIEVRWAALLATHLAVL